MDTIGSYNLLMILNKEASKILTLLRTKNPYQGLYNLPGGKIEADESPLESAYRELFEETGIRETDIDLKPFITYTWHPLKMNMVVFIGKLSEDISLRKEIHPLYWHDIDSNFFDMNTYAGEGNIGHMVEIYKQLKDELFDDIYK